MSTTTGAAQRAARLAVFLLALAPAAMPRPAAAASSGSTTIQTMPALPGVRFTVSGRAVYVADARGRVQIPNVLLGAFRGHLGPANVRVEPLSFGPGRGRAVPDGWWGTDGGTRPMTVGFNVFRPFTLRFIRAVADRGRVAPAVDPETIDRVTIKGSTGAVITIERGLGRRSAVGLPRLYQTEHVVSRQGGPYVSPLQYRIKAVSVRGTNVVRTYQQAFCVGYVCKSHEPAPDSVFYVQLIFYRARFATRDALLPMRIGQGVVLTFPDGTRREYAFTSPGKVDVPALPRGRYLVSVDAPGFSFSRPLTLTRDQDVALQVVSYLDLGIVSVVLTGIVVGLLVVRRPHLIGLRPKGGRPSGRVS